MFGHFYWFHLYYTKTILREQWKLLNTAKANSIQPTSCRGVRSRYEIRFDWNQTHDNETVHAFSASYQHSRWDRNSQPLFRCITAQQCHITDVKQTLTRNDHWGLNSSIKCWTFKKKITNLTSQHKPLCIRQECTDIFNGDQSWV